MANIQLAQPPPMQDPSFPAYVKNVLVTNFGNHLEVSRESGEERVSGYLVWDGFNDLEPIDRQHLVREVLRRELRAEVQGVSIILTYTPKEFEIMSER